MTNVQFSDLRTLHRALDSQRPIRFKPGYAGAGFDLGVLNLGGVVPVFQDQIGLGKSLFYIAFPNPKIPVNIGPFRIAQHFVPGLRGASMILGQQG